MKMSESFLTKFSIRSIIEYFLVKKDGSDETQHFLLRFRFTFSSQYRLLLLPSFHTILAKTPAHGGSYHCRKNRVFT